MEKVSVLDRDGRIYLMGVEEARVAVESGAYQYEGKIPARVPTPKAPLSGKVLHVRERATGKVFAMPAIDAKEAAKTGYFEYVSVDEKKEEEAPKVERDVPSVPPVQNDSTGVGELPKVSSDMTKRQIMQVLREYNIPYRKDMSEAQLLEAWEEFRKQQ